MKYFILYGILLLVMMPRARAQNDSILPAIYLDKIALSCYMGIHVDEPGNNGVSKTISILSDSITIRRPAKGKKLRASRFYNFHLQLPDPELLKVRYRWFLAGDSTKSQWQPLPPSDGRLLSTSIKNSDRLVIQFNIQGEDTVFQEDVFVRKTLAPVIEAYRSKANYDSTDIRLISKSILAGERDITGFHFTADKYFTAKPGKAIEIILRNDRLNKDSCIEYRLYDKSTKSYGGWTLTGRFLTLKDIAANKSHILHLRYTGNKTESQYEIEVLPYWYQTRSAVIIFTCIAAILLFLIPYVVYRLRLKREIRNNTQIRLQLAAVQNQLNPHFVFNALTSIQNLINKNEVAAANTYLRKFADIMRNTLNNSTRPSVSLKEEITMIEDYLNVEKLRFNFNFEIAVSEGLDVYVIEFPPMLLQPTVENAVKHGVAGLDDQGMIRISFNAINNGFEVIIKDNGRKQTTANPDIHGGHGIEITKARIEYLQSLDKYTRIRHDISYSDDGCMATFIFENLND